MGLEISVIGLLYCIVLCLLCVNANFFIWCNRVTCFTLIWYLFHTYCSIYPSFVLPVESGAFASTCGLDSIMMSPLDPLAISNIIQYKICLKNSLTSGQEAWGTQYAGLAQCRDGLSIESARRHGWCTRAGETLCVWSWIFHWVQERGFHFIIWSGIGSVAPADTVYK